MWDFMFGEFRHLRIFVMNVEALSTPRGTKAALTFLQKVPRQHYGNGREHDHQKS